VRKIVETNLLGTIYCCQAVAPALIKRGNGRIINFSTLGVPLAIKGEGIYVASKAESRASRECLRARWRRTELP
jgi:3-oxoacyl-[acyl-carrier protein] reductase